MRGGGIDLESIGSHVPRLYATMRGGGIDPSSCLITHFLDLAIGYKAKRREFSVTTSNLIGTSEFTKISF